MNHDRELIDLRDAVNRLLEENRKLRASLEATDCGGSLLQQEEEFSRLLSVSKRIVSELDLAKVFDLVADNAREIVNAELVIVPMLNEARDRYTYTAASGVDADLVRGTSFGSNIGMCGWVLRHERSLLFGEISTYWTGEKTAWEAGQQSAVLVPLIGRKGIIGGLSALGKQGGGCFTQHDLDLLTMFANQVSIAIENAQLFQQLTREMEQHTRTELALRQSEERFRAIFENSQDAIGISRAGIHHFANPAYHRLFGFAPDADLNGMPVSDFIAPENREQIKENLLRRTAGEAAPMVYETRGLRTNGSEFEMEVHVSSYLEKNEECTLVILRDITERRKAEAAVLQEKKFSETIIDSLPGVFYICDEDGKLLRWNNNEKEVTGYTMAELMSMSVLQLFQEDRERVAMAMKEVFETGKSSVEAKIVSRGGVSIPFYLTGFRMDAADRKYLVGVGIDISERKRLEEQLRQSQKMEAIGQLAGGVAHDFNNILSAIIGYGSIIQMKLPADDPLQLNAVHLLESAERAAQLTHSLLAFSRKQVMNLKPVRPNDIVARLEKFLRRIIGEDVELKTSLRNDAVVLADSSQIEQVLMNLAANARDAMPKGGCMAIETDVVDVSEADARLHGLEASGSYVVISVSDSGAGMDEETRKKIFEPFFTTKEMGRGTGLGLSIVYGIVKQHRGYINVYSQVGSGTTFKIYFPVHQELVEPCDERQEAAAVVGGSETILIAEDDPVLRKFFTEVMTEFGYNVIAAEDGVDAVEKFLKNKYAVQLCVLDMIMPRKGGKESYEEILRQRPDIKVIFASGYTADKIQREGVPAGCEFIQKPVSPQVLLRKVREVLDRKCADKKT